MKFVADNDLGDLGPAQSEPVIQHVRLQDNLSGFAVWLLPLAALILLKENRNAKALMILIPLLVVNLAWLALQTVLTRTAGMASMTSLVFDTLVTGFSAGVALLLLTAHRLSGMNRFLIVLLAWPLIFLALAVSIWGSIGVEWEALAFTVPLGIMATVALAALVLAAVFCRRRYSGGKFAVWLAAWCIILSLGMMMAWVVPVTLISIIAGVRTPLLGMIGAVGLGAALIGCVVYLLLLPFIVLALNNDLYRKRFCGCLRLKSMSTPDDAQTPNEWRTT